MKKLSLICLLVMLSFCSYADNTVDLSNLTDAQKVEVLTQLNKIKNTPVQSKQDNEPIQILPDAEEVQKYVSIGENIGKALGGTARELGIAVNDFANTPVGIIAVMLIIYNYLGSAIISFFGGLLVFLLGSFFIKWWVKKALTTNIYYNEEKTNIFGNHPIKQVETEYNKDVMESALIIYSIFTLICLVIMF